MALATQTQKLSVIPTQAVTRKTQMRSPMLPCFSLLAFAARPFFKQWHIHTVDVTKIMFISYAEARQVMLELRSFLGKSKREVITVDEFCAFTGISKSYVRMHLVSRLLENELLRQANVMV